jgi:hypothetical protein
MLWHYAACPHACCVKGRGREGARASGRKKGSRGASEAPEESGERGEMGGFALRLASRDKVLVDERTHRPVSRLHHLRARSTRVRSTCCDSTRSQPDDCGCRCYGFSHPNSLCSVQSKCGMARWFGAAISLHA